MCIEPPISAFRGSVEVHSASITPPSCPSMSDSPLTTQTPVRIVGAKINERTFPFVTFVPSVAIPPDNMQTQDRDERQIRILCDTVRQTAFELHAYLRSGHLEKVYENGLAHRLRKLGLTVECQKPLQVRDEDGTVLGDYFADLFVQGCLIVELKAVKAIAPEHIAQALGYLRAARQRDAMIINFGAQRLQVRKLIL